MIFALKIAFFYYFQIAPKKPHKKSCIAKYSIYLDILFCTDMGRRIGTLVRHMLLLENPQFLPKNYETKSKCPTHEWIILTKSHNFWVKIVDFLIKAYVFPECQFSCPCLYVS